MDEEKANNFVRGRMIFFFSFFMTIASVTIDYGHTQKRP